MCLKQIDVLLNSMSSRTYVQSHSSKIDGLKYEHELPNPFKEIELIGQQAKVDHTSNLTSKQVTPVVQKFKMSNQFASNSQMPTGAAPPPSATIKKNLNKFSNQIINYEFTWNVIVIIIAYLKNKIKKTNRKTQKVIYSSI